MFAELTTPAAHLSKFRQKEKFLLSVQARPLRERVEATALVLLNIYDLSHGCRAQIIWH